MANELLQSNDMAYIRAEALKSLPDAVDIQRRALESDKQGGYTESWAIVSSSVPARIAFMSAADRFAAGREDAQVHITLTVPFDQLVEQSDRVVISGATFEVVSISNPRSWDTAKRCQLRRM